MQLRAIVTDAAGNLFPTLARKRNKQTQTIAAKLGRSGIVLRWNSSAPDIVEINEMGIISAVREGSVIISAIAGNITAHSIVNVISKKDTFSISPVNATLQKGNLLSFKVFAKNKVQQQNTLSWSVDKPTLVYLDKTGVVYANAPGKVYITAKNQRHHAKSTLNINQNERISGLDFPGNKGTQNTIRFEFRKPMPAYPATYIWRAYPRQQRSYYTVLFWGNDGQFFPKSTYYGFHPYPDWNEDYQHFWEIAAPPGKDYLSRNHVIYDRWYIQVSICDVNDSGVYLTYYWDWPNTKSVLRLQVEKANDPPSPVLVIGDAPWNPGKEVWDGVLRGFQFYDVALSEREISSEIAAPGSTHVPWYLNINPTPFDIKDHSGRGNHPAWVGGERPFLWSGNKFMNMISPNHSYH